MALVKLIVLIIQLGLVPTVITGWVPHALEIVSTFVATGKRLMTAKKHFIIERGFSVGCQVQRAKFLTNIFLPNLC